jgi:hypothetical protein
MSDRCQGLVEMGGISCDLDTINALHDMYTVPKKPRLLMPSLCCINVEFFINVYIG